jgi:predicted RNase H-like HicB family nuclease
MEKQFTAVIVKSDDWYAGTVKELTGVHAQGKTIAELKENLKEAIQLIIESNLNHFTNFSNDYFEEQIAVSI